MTRHPANYGGSGFPLSLAFVKLTPTIVTSSAVVRGQLVGRSAVSLGEMGCTLLVNTLPAAVVRSLPASLQCRDGELCRVGIWERGGGGGLS